MNWYMFHCLRVIPMRAPLQEFATLQIVENYGPMPEADARHMINNLNGSHLYGPDWVAIMGRDELRHGA